MDDAFIITARTNQHGRGDSKRDGEKGESVSIHYITNIFAHSLTFVRNKKPDKVRTKSVFFKQNTRLFFPSYHRVMCNLYARAILVPVQCTYFGRHHVLGSWSVEKKKRGK